jgi:hypothetical protein
MSDNGSQNNREKGGFSNGFMEGVGKAIGERVGQAIAAVVLIVIVVALGLSAEQVSVTNEGTTINFFPSATTNPGNAQVFELPTSYIAATDIPHIPPTDMPAIATTCPPEEQSITLSRDVYYYDSVYGSQSWVYYTYGQTYGDRLLFGYDNTGYKAEVYLSQLSAGQWMMAYEYQDVSVGAFWVCYDQNALYALIAAES